MADEVFGKLFTKEEADKEFGAVLSSKEIETAVLSSLCEKSKNVLMFYFNNGTPAVFASGRISVFPDSALTISEEEVLKVYSVSMIKELIAAGGTKTTIIEKRERHLTITNGKMTLQQATDCPPYC